jgi:hypothetical protein
MSLNQNGGYKPSDELPVGMATRMLAVSIGSVVGVGLLVLAIFSL